MNAVINVIKPSGVSSNKILYIIKNKYPGNKVGHFGTLDPNATGVLPVAIGKATKLFDYFLNKDKVYIATFRFGKTTDTLDSEGEILEDNIYVPSKEEIESNLGKFVGNIEQIPPLYSAINVNGRRAYQIARSGETVELKSKKVKVYEFKLLNQISDCDYQFLIHCSSGTYIRSLCRDIALACNSKAYMPMLIREKAGCFNLENAYTVKEIENNTHKVVSIEELLNDLPKVVLSEDLFFKLDNGVRVDCDCQYDKFLLYCKNELFGIATKDNNNKIKILTNLKEK